MKQNHLISEVYPFKKIEFQKKVVHFYTWNNLKQILISSEYDGFANFIKFYKLTPKGIDRKHIIASDT